jgi:hypothetical protein
MTDLGLPYVPIDPRIMDRQRFLDFLDLLETATEREALSYILMLLLFAGRSHIRGHLGPVTARQIKRICQWEGPPNVLFDAFKASRWLIEDKDGLRIEGWERHGGRLVAERDRKRAWDAANRAKRASKKAPSTQAATARRPSDVGQTSVRPHELELELEDLNTKTAAPTAAALTKRKPETKIIIRPEEKTRSSQTEIKPSVAMCQPLSSSLLIEQSVGVRAFNAFVRKANVAPAKSPQTLNKIATMAPYSQQELESALELTRNSTSNPNVGLLLLKIGDVRRMSCADTKPVKLSHGTESVFRAAEYARLSAAEKEREEAEMALKYGKVMP